MADLSVKAVLTDIEGTTTSISFVKDILFPYAKEHTREFLKETWSDVHTENLITELLNLRQFEEYVEINKTSNERSVDNVANFVNYLIDRDLKLGPLKILQGLVWQQGYASGQLKGHVYDDVQPAFKRWQQDGIKIAIYSSGSVRAQQLLFRQTKCGNLLPYILAHFDTAIGHKQEPQSYINIANVLEFEPQQIVFLTDIYQEAKAAKNAGMQAILVRRPGNAALTEEQESEFIVLNDFLNLQCHLPK